MFGIPLSGLNACQKYLDVTSNNISNANSYGFKKSRAEFADIYSSNVFTSTKTATGMGVLTSTVAQQFSQGSLTGDTGNNLDMAIEGNGFFVLAPSANANNTQATESRTYTRNGAFEIDADGYVVTSSGDYLQFYDINDEDEATNLTINATHALQIPSTTGAPKASSKLSIGVNLPANAEAKTLTSFDPTDSTTYNAATSETVHDSLGGAHTLTYYFIKNTPDAKTGNTTWNVITMVDGTSKDNLVDLYDGNNNALTANAASFTVNNGASPLNGQTVHGATLVFNTSGEMLNDQSIPTNGNFFLANAGSAHPTNTGHSLAHAMGGGVDTAQDVAVSLSATQYGSSSFNVSVTPTDDGYSTGLLTNISVNDDGVMLATYSNGRQVHLAKVAMANFINPQGLTKIGDTQWQESIDSGEPMAIQANVGVAGAIKGANLEQSNVDLTASLVDLIIAQRTYQANCQALQTQNTMMDAIMSVR
ncbi:MAG: flagellar hook protein FlgE [Aeromonadales bacterium]|nr:flagellar hook protein FlgE [Aeromonadales bacterium]MDY2890228.1 flagellar hook protein FlgE [Succinivibrio sp.]